MPNTATFTEQARDQLLEGLRSGTDGREIGGWFYGVVHNDGLLVRHCSVDSHVERTGDRIRLDSRRAFEVGKERRERHGEVLLGDWHTHPGDKTDPTDADRSQWSVLAGLVEKPTFLSLIVGGTSARPTQAAWITSQDRNGRTTCTPTTISGAPFGARSSGMNDSSEPATVELLGVLAGVGEAAERAATDANRREWAARENANDIARRAEHLARAIKRARRRAVVLYDEWKQTRSGKVFEMYLESQRAEKTWHGELRELLCEDESLIAQVKASAGLA